MPIEDYWELPDRSALNSEILALSICYRILIAVYVLLLPLKISYLVNLACKYLNKILPYGHSNLHSLFLWWLTSLHPQQLILFPNNISCMYLTNPILILTLSTEKPIKKLILILYNSIVNFKFYLLSCLANSFKDNSINWWHSNLQFWNQCIGIKMLIGIICRQSFNSDFSYFFFGRRYW